MDKFVVGSVSPKSSPLTTEEVTRLQSEYDKHIIKLLRHLGIFAEKKPFFSNSRKDPPGIPPGPSICECRVVDFFNKFSKSC